MNKERLRKLAQKLARTKPERFNMATWCGTACCIGGHALIMAGKSRRPDVRHTWFNYAKPFASGYLGLHDTTASALMDVSNTNAVATPKQAAKVIRHLIKTGRVEWRRFIS